MGINENAVGLTSKISGGSRISQRKGVNSKGGVSTYIIWLIFPENLLEHERNWTEKGARPWRSLDLPMKMSANCSVNDAFIIYIADKNERRPWVGSNHQPFG